MFVFVCFEVTYPWRSVVKESLKGFCLTTSKYFTGARQCLNEQYH